MNLIPSMKHKLLSWLQQAWPDGQRRRALIAAYRQFGLMPGGKLILADIALRGGVHGGLPRVPGDVFGDGINEGRRLLASEIIEAASADPAELFALIERKPATKERS